MSVNAGSPPATFSSSRSFVFVARHGEIASNRARRYAGRSSEGLTPLGRQQAETLAERVAGQGIAEVRTSEIARAEDTARIVAERLRIPLVRDRRLNEMLLGPWEGLTEHEVEALYPEAYQVWNSRPDQLALEGRESLHAVARRVAAVLADVVPRPAPVLLVTHVALIRVAALETLGLPLARYKSICVPNAEVFRFDTANHAVHRLEAPGCLKEELAFSGSVDAA